MEHRIAEKGPSDDLRVLKILHGLGYTAKTRELGTQLSANLTSPKAVLALGAFLADNGTHCIIGVVRSVGAAQEARAVVSAVLDFAVKTDLERVQTLARIQLLKWATGSAARCRMRRDRESADTSWLWI
jgi:hypothetical protein